MLQVSSCRCRLSKRQRTLYEDYMASSDTSATLASSNFLGIINVLMQLRKVKCISLPACNVSNLCAKAVCMYDRS